MVNVAAMGSKSLRCTLSPKLFERYLRNLECRSWAGPPPAFECCGQGSIGSCQHIFGRRAVLERRASAGNCSHLLMAFVIPRTFARHRLASSSRRGLLCSTGGTKLESHSRSWTSLQGAKQGSPMSPPLSRPAVESPNGGTIPPSQRRSCTLAAAASRSLLSTPQLSQQKSLRCSSLAHVSPIEVVRQHSRLKASCHRGGQELHVLV